MIKRWRGRINTISPLSCCLLTQTGRQNKNFVIRFASCKHHASGLLATFGTLSLTLPPWGKERPKKTRKTGKTPPID